MLERWEKAFSRLGMVASKVIFFATAFVSHVLREALPLEEFLTLLEENGGFY